FIVTAIGASPFSYQWQFRGTNISGATNASLQLVNVSAGQAGVYSVVVSNGFGAVTSYTATLLFSQIAAWGDNSSGQKSVSAGLTNVVMIAAGYYHGLALQANSTVAAWGDNSTGQTNLPVGLTNIVSIACGGYHNLALRADGTVE